MYFSTSWSLSVSNAELDLVPYTVHVGGIKLVSTKYCKNNNTGEARVAKLAAVEMADRM